MLFWHPENALKWPEPNYINPDLQGPAIYYVNTAFLLLATLAVAARIYSRLFVRRWFGLDDALLLSGWVFSVGDLVTVFWGYRYHSWDRHLWDIPFGNVIPGTKVLFVAKILWTCASSLIRLSILAFYYRLLKHIQLGRYRWVLDCVTVFVIGGWISFLGTTIFACVPVSGYFSWPSKGVCLNEGLSLTVLSALNTFSEAVVAALPIPVIFMLDMKPHQRWNVLCLLCVGFLVAAVGAVRTYYVYTLYSTGDLTWYSSPHWICSEVELSTAMICASVPSIRSLVATWLRHGPNTYIPAATTYTHQAKPSQSSSYYRASSEVQTTRTLSTDSQFRPFDGTNPHPVMQTRQGALYRMIDLEGISIDDGCGYSVTVTTLQPRQQSRRSWMKSKVRLQKRRTGDIEAARMDAPLPPVPVQATPRIKSLKLSEGRFSIRSWSLPRKQPPTPQPIQGPNVREIITRGGPDFAQNGQFGVVPRRSPTVMNPASRTGGGGTSRSNHRSIPSQSAQIETIDTLRANSSAPLSEFSPLRSHPSPSQPNQQPQPVQTSYYNWSLQAQPLIAAPSSSSGPPTPRKPPAMHSRVQSFSRRPFWPATTPTTISEAGESERSATSPITAAPPALGDEAYRSASSLAPLYKPMKVTDRGEGGNDTAESLNVPQSETSFSLENGEDNGRVSPRFFGRAV